MRSVRRRERRGRDAHVECRADVEPHREAVQLRHHHVLETCALELLCVSEHFGPDEARHVVDDHPARRRRPADVRAGFPPEMTRDPVRPRLERHHVDALGGAVGHRRSLARLEIQPIEAPREVEHTVDVQADHAGKRPRRAGEALESDVDPRVRLRLVLLDDVRQHAVAGGQLEAPDDLCEQLLEPDDRVEIVGGRIEADDHVAAAVRQPLEDREQNLLFVVSRAVRLDARAEVPRTADGDAFARPAD